MKTFTPAIGRVRVLHDVTLSLASGEAIGVLGPNGAGKTTLLRAIAGLCTVYDGSVVFDGKPLDGMPDTHGHHSGSRMCRKDAGSGHRSPLRKIC